jgi:hypothetical protein
VGQVVRFVLLLVLSALAYWKVGTPAALVLLVAAVVPGILGVIAFMG